MFALIPTCGAARERVCVPACTLRAGGGRRLRVWGHQVLAVRLNKKKCQHSAPGGCAGSSPLPSAPRSEHPASDSQQHPFASAPELSSPSPLAKLRSAARPDPRLSAVTRARSPEDRMVTLDGQWLCSLLLPERLLETALISCQTGASQSTCKVLLYPKSDQQGHLLNSHLQLMAGCSLLPPFTPSPSAEAPQGWHPNKRSRLSWLVSPSLWRSRAALSPVPHPQSEWHPHFLHGARHPPPNTSKPPALPSRGQQGRQSCRLRAAETKSRLNISLPSQGVLNSDVSPR